MQKINPKKVGIIGCGFVGSATAFALMQSSLFTEISLIDVDEGKAEGEALDISHGSCFADATRIYAGTYDDIVDSAVIVLTAGANQKEGETRLDLAAKNVGIFRQILPELSSRSYGGVLLVVANPVDVLTRAAVTIGGFSAHRVIGSGTVLDTARLRNELSAYLGVSSRSVHAYVIGEHGDSEIVAWRSANVSGVPIDAFCSLRGRGNSAEAMRVIGERVRNVAYEIIKRKKATYYGIAMSVRRICEAIVRDEKAVLPVSSVGGLFGDIALSLPAVVGANGVETRVPLSLSDEEKAALENGAQTLRGVIKELGL